MVRRHSFKHKLTLWVVGVATVMSAAIFGVCIHYAAEEVRKDVLKTAGSKLDYALRALDEGLTATEISAENLVGVNLSSLTCRDTLALYPFLKIFLDSNPRLQGVVLGYESSDFSPCMMRRGDDYIHLDLAQSMDYRSGDWYRKTVEAGEPRWSKPFCVRGGDVMSTYNIPLRDEAGEVYAVVAAALSLNAMADSLQTLKPYPHAMLTVVDEDGTFVAHPDTSFILKKSLQSVIDSVPYEANPDILDAIMSRTRGWDRYDDFNEVHYLFHAPAEKVKWTVTLDMPRRDIASGLDVMFWSMTVTTVIGLLLLLAVCYALISRITRPLEDFATAAKKISGGDFDAELPALKAHDELYDLRDALSSMEGSLTSYISRLRKTTEEKAAIEGELNIAKSIQMAMAPKTFPAREDIEISASITPAKAVGGDLYDCIIDGDELVFCIGDVSGKGVPAALIMAITIALFRTASSHTKSPSSIAGAINDLISKDNEQNMFITLLIGHLHLRTGVIEWCNCGHNPPVLSGKFDSSMPVNIPIGVIPDFDYKGAETTLPKESFLFLYTDGVTEASDSSQSLFGSDRLLKSLDTSSSSAAVDSVRRAVAEFVGGAEQSDDITMLCLKYHGRPETLSIVNDVSEMPRVTAYVEDVCARAGLDCRQKYHVDLAVDEAVTNAVLYAYPDGTRGQVRLSSSVADGSLTFVLENDGPEFDPTQKGDPDITLSAEERPVGGLGIFLIRKVMDEVSYRRNGETNVLTMIKKI